MTKQEAEAFESLSNFSAILEMRTWDEKAKDVSIELVNNDKFKNLIRKILEESAEWKDEIATYPLKQINPPKALLACKQRFNREDCGPEESVINSEQHIFFALIGV